MPRGQRGKLKLPEHGAWGSPERVTETEKTHSGSFFFLSLLSLDGRSVFRSEKGNTLFEDGGGFFFRCERRAREGAFVALPAQATSRSRLESGAFDVLEAAQVPDRRCESLRRSPRGGDY